MTDHSGNLWSRATAKGLQALSARDAAAMALGAAIFFGGLLWSQSANTFTEPSRIVHEWASCVVMVVVMGIALIRLGILWLGGESIKWNRKPDEEVPHAKAREPST